MNRLRKTLFAIAAVATLGGCFIGYDSRWGQAKAAQQKIASQSTPTLITTKDDAHPREPQRTYRIRFRPNGHYLAQTVDTPRQLYDLVADANTVLEPSLALHLEPDSAQPQPWSFDADDTQKGALDALRRDDLGDGADVVVGLIGALPRPTESFHEIGYAEVLGKYVILRASSRLGEHDAFDRALADLSEDERDRVVRARRRHRAEAVFLHELGHILGAPHEADVASVMHPAYDEKMSGFSEGGLALMRLALDGTDRRSVAQAQYAYLRDAKSSPWTSEERDAAMARLQAWLSPTPPAQSVEGNRSTEAAPPELHETDRATFVRAIQSFRAGDTKGAYATARPLFATYPNSYAVQDLRCQLAAVRWLDPDEMVAECAPAVRLADAGAR